MRNHLRITALVFVMIFACQAAFAVTVKFNANMPQNDGNMNAAIPENTTVATGSPYGDIFTWRVPDAQTYRRGYTFTGWNTMADGNGINVTSTTICNATTEVTLYAQWETATMTVTFNVNGGTWTTQPNPNPFTVHYGTTYREQTSWNWQLPTREGKIFMGWCTSPDGEEMFFGPDALVSLTTNHTLYAVWEDQLNPSELQENLTVCYEKPATICAPANYSGYKWTPTTGLSDPNIRCPQLTPSAMTTDNVSYSCSYTLGNIYNYNFSMGGKGFASDYDILEDDPTSIDELEPARKMCVVSCWADVHHTLDQSCDLVSYEGDYADGGKFLAINGGAFTNEVVWEQTAAIAHNTTYRLSIQCAKPIHTSGNTLKPAKLLFFINGVRVSTDTMVVDNLDWQEMSAVWNSGTNDFATICIKDFSTEEFGNDFALDHVVFYAVETPEPGVYTMNVHRMAPLTAGAIATGSEVICTGSSVNTIGEATAPAGGTQPYSYRWYVSVNGGTPTLITGANDATYTPNEYKNAIGTYVFTREVKDSECANWTASTGQWTLEVRQGLLLDACPEDMVIELWMDTPDTMLTPELAGIQVFYDAAEAAHIDAEHLHITQDIDAYNRMTVGEYTIHWVVKDDCDNIAKTCNQKITVVYPPCVGKTYEGHTYDAVRVGYQCWFTENLRNNNKPDGTTPVANKNTYDENPANTEKYGDLYSWYSAVDVTEGDNAAVPNGNYVAENGSKYVQGICPQGWAVPSEHDFDVLNDFAGDVAYLKDMDAQYWVPGKGGKEPNLGFYSRGSGRYSSATNKYEDLLSNAYYWRATSTPGSSTIISSEINYYCTEIMPHTANKTDLQSIRCIKKKRFSEE